jgi:methylated-DNA-[protein]-cysteine S-methyltransferase
MSSEVFMIESMIGPMSIAVKGAKIESIQLIKAGGALLESGAKVADSTPQAAANWDEIQNPIAREAAQQLEAYFQGSLKRFDLPLNLEALTPFRRKVLEALLTVPYGKTISYKALAIQAGSPDAARAVGGVVAKNDWIVVVPCHRVIRSDGDMRGFSAPGGIKTKAWLLDHERNHKE